MSDVASRESRNPYHGLIYFFSKILLIIIFGPSHLTTCPFQTAFIQLVLVIYTYIKFYLQRQWWNRRTFLSFTLGASALALKQIYNHLLATEIRCTDWTELIIASRQLQYTCTWNTKSWCRRHYHSWSQRAGSVYDCEVLVVDFFHSGVESFSSQQTQAILVRESSRGLANGTIMVGLNVWVQLLD